MIVSGAEKWHAEYRWGMQMYMYNTRDGSGVGKYSNDVK
jgi:hypothetical protein